MGQTPLKCGQPAAQAIYDSLMGLDRAGAFPRGLKLDSGTHPLNYRHPSKPKETIEGKVDGEISCEEVWENGLQALDVLGEMANWEEEPVEDESDARKKAIERYQKFRALIECKTKRPIPWVFEAPYLCKNSILKKTEIPRDHKKLKQAKEIRTKVKRAVNKLKESLAKENLGQEQYQRCLIACLWWFVIFGDVKGIPKQVDRFLKKEGLSYEVIHKIENDFSKYLNENKGGLGLVNVEQDAKLEATALETVLRKKGGCTEQSKVMYAVLRMAGIEAFFVEPQLSIEYFLAKNNQPSIPLQGHMASGVGIKIMDENGKEKIWIVDVALQLLEADYIEEKAGQWNAHPHWELSLRHFYMADLANLGKNQTDQGDFLGAERSFKTALDLGQNSTAFHTMGNYAWLLSKKGKKLSRRSQDYKNIYEQVDAYSKKAIEINPHDPGFQFSRGEFLMSKKNWKNGKELIIAFLQSIDADPRFVRPYQKLGSAIYNIRQGAPDLFSTIWAELEKQMREIVQKHPLLKEVIKKGLEVMQNKIPSTKPSGKELIDLIEKLKKD